MRSVTQHTSASVVPALSSYPTQDHHNNVTRLVMSLSPSLTHSHPDQAIIIVVSVQIFAQDPITGIDFNVSHSNYRLISDLQVK